MGAGMYLARLCDNHNVLITIAESGHNTHELMTQLVPPSHVERSTGTLRSPEFTVDASTRLVADLLDVEPAAVAGPVIGLLVHTVSHRTAAIGVFTAATVANSWWWQPYNKLAKNPDVVFLAIPVVEGLSG